MVSLDAVVLLRSVCVTENGFSFASAASLAARFDIAVIKRKLWNNKPIQKSRQTGHYKSNVKFISLAYLDAFKLVLLLHSYLGY